MAAVNRCTRWLCGFTRSPMRPSSSTEAAPSSSSDHWSMLIPRSRPTLSRSRCVSAGCRSGHLLVRLTTWRMSGDQAEPTNQSTASARGCVGRSMRRTTAATVTARSLDSVEAVSGATERSSSALTAVGVASTTESAARVRRPDSSATSSSQRPDVPCCSRPFAEAVLSSVRVTSSVSIPLRVAS